MIVEAINDPASEAGSIELQDVSAEVVSALQDMNKVHTSWVMLTPGRFPRDALNVIGRSEIGAASVAAGLLTSRKIGGDSITLGLSPLSHYMTSNDNLVEQGILPGGYPLASVMTLSQAMDIVASNTILSPVRKGLAIRNYGPTDVTLDGGYRTSLDFVRWLAGSFGAVWRIRLGYTPEGTWPILDIAPIGDLWGEELLTSIVLSPVLDPSIPKADAWMSTPASAAPTVVRGSLSRDDNAEGVISTAWGMNLPADAPNIWLAGNNASVTAPLGVYHPNGLGLLPRHKMVQSSVNLTQNNKVPALTAIAQKVLNAERWAEQTWTVEADTAEAVLSLPLGAAVAVYDPVAGIYDKRFATSVYYNGVDGGAPKYGFRVIRKEWPFVEGMGLYVALSTPGEYWRVLDLSDFVAPSDGSATIGYGVNNRSLRASLLGQAKA